MSEPILRAEGLGRAYGERVQTRALTDVGLVIERGEFVALTGPSGSGKSTLLNLIGLLDRPTEGRLWIDGIDTSTLDDAGRTRLRAEKLGFVFQFHHLLPAFTALENVTMPAWGDLGRRPADSVPAGEALLAAVGLAGLGHRVPGELSGGQQQRVAIARALSRRPALVLADEPTGNLDTQSGEEVFALLRRFNREERTTFVIVTHDPRIADRCDRVIELVDGRLRRDVRTPPR